MTKQVRVTFQTKGVAEVKNSQQVESQGASSWKKDSQVMEGCFIS